MKIQSKTKLHRSPKDSKQFLKVMKEKLIKRLLKNLRLLRKKGLLNWPIWIRLKQPLSNRSKPRRKRKGQRNGLWSGTFNMLLCHMLFVISFFRSLDNYQSSRSMEHSKCMDLERSGVMIKIGKLMLKFTIMKKCLKIMLSVKKLDWDYKIWTFSCNSWTAWSLVLLLSNVRFSSQLVTSNTYHKQEEAWTCFVL